MKCNIPNRKDELLTLEEEQEKRQKEAEDTAKILEIIINLLNPLIAQIPDPRDPRYIQYTKENLFLYGITMFCHQMTSRRETNRQMTDAITQKNLSLLMPGLNRVPHADTLAKYLERIGNPHIIQEIHCGLLKKLLRNQSFQRLAGRYIVLVDGTGKDSKDWKFSNKALHRTKDGKTTYLTYVLEAVLVLENGMVFPLCTEFLENVSNEEFDKQDCETKAWKRMAKRLRKIIGKEATIIFDGLYASGPTVLICKKYNWDYMITFKDGSMPALAEDAHGLMRLEKENRLVTDIEGRHIAISWINDVEHKISRNNTYMGLNVVRMEETWTELYPNTGKPPEDKKATYQWISSQALSKENVLEVCRLGRSRWFIENHIKTMKEDYSYEHCFSLNWEVNIAYHYFMNFGFLINIILMSSELLSGLVAMYGGISGFLARLRKIISGIPFDGDRIRDAISKGYRIDFNLKSIYLHPNPT